MSDLESALHYSLRQEVAIKRLIDADALESLRQFLNVLAKVNIYTHKHGVNTIM